MAIKKFINPYIGISLISAILCIVGLFIYAQYQKNNLQTPTKVYKELTEAEEAIVKENIKVMAQQHKQKEEKKEDTQQSTVDDTPIQYGNLDIPPEFTPSEKVVTNTKADTSDIEKLTQEHLKKKSITKLGPESSFDSKTIFGQLPLPVGVQENGEGTTIQVNSREELERVIAQLEASGDSRHNALAQMLRNSNFRDNVRMTVHTSVPLDQ
ncbi:hypothetical protein F4212_07300 [Candidatus Poribacteria bacterium]|nr:hypothetical protein [Candidatus Poribacteria bacterium]